MPSDEFFSSPIPQLLGPSYDEHASYFGNPQDDSGQIVVTKVLLREMGSYNEQYNRTYRTDVRGEHLAKFGEVVAQSGSQLFTPSRVAGALLDMVHIQAAPMSTSPILINHGWGQRRLGFMIYVDVIQTQGTASYVIQGYTDSNDVSFNHVNPEMNFFINNIVAMRTDMRRFGAGRREQTVMSSNFQVLSNANANMCGIFDKNSKQTAVRPQDVFSLSSTDKALPGKSQTDIYSSSNTIGHRPISSRRSNNSPAAYTATVLNGYVGPVSRILEGYDQKDVLAQGMEETRESMVNDNLFMRAIANQGYSRSTATAVFPWRDLMKLAPNVEDVTKMVVQGATTMQGSQLHSVGSSSEWYGGNKEDQVASTLSSALPTLMMECMISEISFSMTNMITGQFTWVPGIVTTFSNEPGGPLVERLLERVGREIMADLSHNNEYLGYDIEVDCMVFGETTLMITLSDGQVTREAVRYVTPSFCDGLLAPVISSDRQTATDIALNMKTLAEITSDNIGASPTVTNSFNINKNLF